MCHDFCFQVNNWRMTSSYNNYPIDQLLCFISQISCLRSPCQTRVNYLILFLMGAINCALSICDSFKAIDLPDRPWTTEIHCECLVLWCIISKKHQELSHPKKIITVALQYCWYSECECMHWKDVMEKWNSKTCGFLWLHRAFQSKKQIGQRYQAASTSVENRNEWQAQTPHFIFFYMLKLE